MASKHINDMTSSFKLKTEQFSSNIQSDLKKRTKPILKGSAPMDTRTGTDDADEPRTYREESRVAQYGNIVSYLQLLEKDTLMVHSREYSFRE